MPLRMMHRLILAVVLIESPFQDLLGNRAKTQESASCEKRPEGNE
jgi:hypothetical protein